MHEIKINDLFWHILTSSKEKKIGLGIQKTNLSDDEDFEIFPKKNEIVKNINHFFWTKQQIWLKKTSFSRDFLKQKQKKTANYFETF